MPEPIDPALAAADQHAENLAAQQRANPGADIKPSFDDARGDALDNMLAEVQAAPSPEPGELGRENGGVREEVEGAPKGVVAESAAVSAATTSAQTAASSAADNKPRGLLDDLLSNAPAASAAVSSAADPYGEVKLRSDASPKTRETFEQLKNVAREREIALQKERDEIAAARDALQKERDELAVKTAQVPPEILKELEEHRQFRVQFDVENTPEFKQKYDSRVNNNFEAIYSRLAQHGLPQTELERLKTFSIADRNNAIEGFLDKLPSESRRLIEAKLVDNVNALEERQTTLQSLRAKAPEILSQRQKNEAEALAKRDTEIANTIKPALATLPWIHIQEIPATAAPEERKRLEAENEFAATMQDALRTAITDDSPRTRAEAALAVPLARYYKRQFDAVSAQLKAATEKVAAIEKASNTSRTARTLASTRPAPAPVNQQPSDPADALDALFQGATGQVPRA